MSDNNELEEKVDIIEETKAEQINRKNNSMNKGQIKYLKDAIKKNQE
jgi:hypothetical protein